MRENAELSELQRRLHDAHESSARLRDRIAEIERERDEARRAVEYWQAEAGKECTLAHRAEKERDEAIAALSGRTVSCSQCNESAKQLEAMREAIKEAWILLDTISPDVFTYSSIPGAKRVCETKDKLKPFLP